MTGLGVLTPLPFPFWKGPLLQGRALFLTTNSDGQCALSYGLEVHRRAHPLSNLQEWILALIEAGTTISNVDTSLSPTI